MTTTNVIRKVSQSIRRNRGATFGTGGGGGGGFTGSAGPLAAAARFPGAGPDGLAPGLFALSSLIFLVIPSRSRKRTNTRSGTTYVCPFKTICRNVVLVRFKAARKIGDHALVAQNHCHHRPAVG